jgi:hypothetical protein
VTILATSRKAGDAESLPMLTGGMLLAHAILASMSLEIWLLIAYPAAGWTIAVVCAFVWIRTRDHRRKFRALIMWQRRLAKLK